MGSFLEWLTGRGRTTSAEIAKERLKLVLVTDRSHIPQERLEAMQAEIIEVIKRYVEVDTPQVQLKIEQRDRHNYLVADIPLQRDRSYQPASESDALPETDSPPPDSAAPPPPTPARGRMPPRTSSKPGIVEPDPDPGATVPHIPSILDDD